MKDIELNITGKADPRLKERMEIHYSHPKGFVGRSICYAVLCDGMYYGHIVADPATMNLPGRHEFLGTTKRQLNNIINNVFYNVKPAIDSKYPVRNFTTKVLNLFMERAAEDWENKYGNKVLGFETLVELPRVGELYLKGGWTVVGETKGYTCKRIGGKGTDNWGGRRVWNYDILKPKTVLCYKWGGQPV